MDTKQCTICGEAKGIGEFHSEPKAKDGRTSGCKECKNKAGLARYNRRKEKEQAAPTTRKCFKCGEVKTSDCFYKNKGYPGGIEYRCKACAKVYRLANKDKVKFSSAAINARKKAESFGITGPHATRGEIRDKFSLLGDCCYYCGTGKRLTVDHMIPLSRGGSNKIDNIVPSCFSCNCRKNNYTHKEFKEKQNGRYKPSPLATPSQGDEGDCKESSNCQC